MDNRTLQRKLNQFVKLGMELHQEAERRYGEEAQLFHEADGGVYIMSGDSCGGADERQKFIEHTAKGNALWAPEHGDNPAPRMAHNLETKHDYSECWKPDHQGESGETGR